MAADVSIGIDLGGTNLRFGLVDQSAQVVARFRTGTEAAKGVKPVISRLKRGISTLAAKAEAAGHRVIGIGIGVPGIISAGEGVVEVSPNLPGWVDIPLGKILSEAFPHPVFVENDANAYALGEYRFGAGRGAKSLLCVTLGTGVGGGIILDGKIWRGANGMAGEIGHVTVDPNGPRCPCGNSGCLERYSSATAIVETARAALLKGRKSSLTDPFKEDPASLTAEAVDKAARAGDALAIKIYADAGRYLGIALASVINLLNIEMIVIGGGLAGAWDLFIGSVKEEIESRAFEIPAKSCEILPGALGDDAGILGAASLSLKSRKA